MMKTALLLSALLLAAPSVRAAEVVLADDFNSYTPGALLPASAWPGSIPGTSPAVSWTTNNGGPQTIVDGTALGRTGQLYRYQEIAAGQTSTYSTATLTTPIGAQSWELSLDFYLDSVLPAGGGWFGIIAIGNGALTTSGNHLFNLSVSRVSGGNANAISFNSGSQFTTADDSGRAASTGAWYHLTLANNVTDQQITYTITSENYSMSKTIAYRNSLTGFDAIGLGDVVVNGWLDGRNNSIYIDNVRLEAIPEPSTLALLPGAVLLVGAVRHLRRRTGR